MHLRRARGRAGARRPLAACAGRDLPASRKEASGLARVLPTRAAEGPSDAPGTPSRFRALGCPSGRGGARHGPDTAPPCLGTGGLALRASRQAAGSSQHGAPRRSPRVCCSRTPACARPAEPPPSREKPRCVLGAALHALKQPGLPDPARRRSWRPVRPVRAGMRARDAQTGRFGGADAARLTHLAMPGRPIPAAGQLPPGNPKRSLGPKALQPGGGSPPSPAVAPQTAPGERHRWLLPSAKLSRAAIGSDRRWRNPTSRARCGKALDPSSVGTRRHSRSTHGVNTRHRALGGAQNSRPRLSMLAHTQDLPRSAKHTPARLACSRADHHHQQQQLLLLPTLAERRAQLSGRPPGSAWLPLRRF